MNPVDYLAPTSDLLLPPNAAQIVNALDEKATWIVDIDPRLFLDLCREEPVAYYLREAAPLSVYLSPKAQANMIVHPGLSIDQETGKVESHEGRHRAAAVMKAGGKWYRIAITLRPSSRRYRPKDMPRVWESQHHPGYFVNIDQAMRDGYMKIVNDHIQQEYWR